MFDRKVKWKLKVAAAGLCITFTKERPLRWWRPWNFGNTEALILILSEGAPVFSPTQLRTSASLIPHRSGFMTFVCITVSFDWCVCFAAPKFWKESKKINLGCTNAAKDCFIHAAIVSSCVKIVVPNQQFEEMRATITPNTYAYTQRPVHNGL